MLWVLGGSLPPELSLIQVSLVSHRTVVTELARRNDGFTPGKMPCAKQGLFQHANGRKIFYVNFYRDTPYNLCNLRPLSN